VTSRGRADPESRAWRERIEAIFEEALDMPAAARSAWLAEACGEDRQLQAEVEALLAASAQPDGILGAPAAALAMSLVEERAPARRIGPYRVLRELGRGGMGVVYLAERSDGHFRRRVAVKLLRASPDADELHRRFLAERQILASLSHPNIAQLLDGGVSEGQLPYLVIEFVDGVSITDYCDRQRLGIEARLRLFQAICAAVHHAHRNLVLHRDLKPGNILVTTDGQVKLLDFGIAKLLNPDLSAAEQPVTHTAFRLMTPAYASPEQVRGESLTTASDVYALGLVLYELLTGWQAHQVESDAPREVIEAVCEREPDRPSVRVRRIAAGAPADGRQRAAIGELRDASPARLARQLHGDLDAIVMMALRKEPGRRYGSADLLAADIARYLEGLSVLAHRGSGWYRAGKVLRRHRRLAVAGALLALSLVGGATAAAWQAGIAQLERDRATLALADSERALRQSEEVTSFLVGLFEASDPSEGRRDTLTAADLLRRGATRVERLSTEPLVQARMLDALGRVHVSLGDLSQGERFGSRALELRRAHLGTQHQETAATAARLADVLRRRGAYARAESLAAEALTVRRGLPAPSSGEVAASLRQLSGLAVYRGDLSRAVSLMREAIAVRRVDQRHDDSLTVRDLLTLGSVLWRNGRLSDGLGALREAVAVAERVNAAPSAQTAETKLRLSDRLAELPGDLSEAESLARGALEETRAALGAEHPQTASVMQQVGGRLSQRGQHAEAQRLLRDALALQRRAHGPSHPTVAASMNALAAALSRSGQVAEAEAVAREALPIWEATYGPRHSAYAGALGGLAEFLELRGALDSAAQLHRRAVEIRIAAVGPDNPLTAITTLGLARTLGAQRQFAVADSMLQWALDLLKRNMGNDHPDVRRAHAELARLYEAWGRSSEATRHRRLATSPPDSTKVTVP